MTDASYSPRAFFRGLDNPLPRVLLSPQKYVQGSGALNHLGQHLALLDVQRAAVLGSKRCLTNEGAKAASSICVAGIDLVTVQFNGECSINEIEAQVNALQSDQPDCESPSAAGKTVDAGKCIAHRLNIPAVIAPTLASNDAPCSTLSVVYTPQGVQNPLSFLRATPFWC